MENLESQKLLIITASLGNSLNFNNMISTALHSYKRELNCSSVGFYQWIEKVAQYSLISFSGEPEKEEDVEEILSKTINEYSQKPYVGLIRYGKIAYLFPLKQIGLLLIIKDSERFSKEAISLLGKINQQFTYALNQCLLFQNIHSKESFSYTRNDFIRTNRELLNIDLL